VALLTTSPFFIDPSDIEVFLNDSRGYSFVQGLGSQVELSLAGGRYLNMNDLAGGFVGQEGGKKPVADPTVTTGDILVREWAVVVPISKRLYNFNPSGIVPKIRAELPKALARGFDDLAITGAGVSGQSNLSQVTQTVSLGTTTQANGGVWGDFNKGLDILAASDKELTGTALDLRVEPVINAAVDTTGHPLFIDTPVGPDTNAVARQGRMLGRPAQFVKKLRTGAGSTKVVGYMGDWTRLLWGIIGGMEFTVSTEGTYVDGSNVTHSAIQENLILFRAEALIGVQVADLNAFVKVLAGTSGAATS
jgi:HK97 family phage major capsid protein